MPDDTSQQMIDAAKRKLQKQAVPRMDPDFDMGQEIFLKEMREAEAEGDLPPATVTTTDEYESGASVVQDPTGTGKTPQQVADHLESERREAREATVKAYGHEDYEKAPAWLRDGLRKIGLTGPEEQVPSASLEGGFESINKLRLIGQGRLKHRNPKIQREAMALYRRFKSDPSYDYYGYGSEESQRRLQEEFPARS